MSTRKDSVAIRQEEVAWQLINKLAAEKVYDIDVIATGGNRKGPYIVQVKRLNRKRMERMVALIREELERKS